MRKNMLINMLDFLTDKARGLLITGAGFSIGTVPEVAKDAANLANNAAEAGYLETIQSFAYTATFVVAVLTIISYGYKFYIWLKNYIKDKKK